MLGLVGLLLGVAVLAGSADVDADGHVLQVPYRSQLDGSAYAGANCGPAALSMMLAYYGIDASPWDLRVKSMKAQRSWVDDEGGYSDRYGVFVYNLATVAESYGLQVEGLWQREGQKIDRMRRWRAKDLRQQIELNRPVIVQVYFRELPGNSGFSGLDDHFIVVHGMRDEDFVYSDPIDGPDQVISEARLLKAMELSDSPLTGFALSKPK
jgi:hypothetical protein